MGKSGKAQPYHRGNVPEDLRLAALRLLKTMPYEALTIRRLASEIGVTAASFYNHYDRLETLLLEVAAAEHRRHGAIMAAIAESAPTRAQAARAMAVAMVEFAAADPQVFRIMFSLPGGQSHAEFQAARDEAFGILVRMVYGEERLHRMDAEARARCPEAYGFFSLVYGLSHIAMERNVRFDNAAGLRAFVETVVDGFIAGSAAAVFAGQGRDAAADGGALPAVRSRQSGGGARSTRSPARDQLASLKPS